ncbi:XRE family transcriptional regulator [Ectopseudomonas khazarica]|uniref:XRE family transcriptional regulator n=1 Tax=Ectopseudomonas khazarica TaxID=2502979 RepID=UPI003A910A74
MDVKWTDKELSRVFGIESSGSTLEERAETSSRLFVRSQIQIGFDNERAKGRRINAREALDTFGEEVLRGLADYEAVPILLDALEPGKTIKERRINMGLSLGNVARAVHIEEEVLKGFENSEITLPIRTIENIARTLVLDESLLGHQPGAGGDHALGVRLREFLGAADQNLNSFTPQMVMRLSEAAWVIKRQNVLQVKLGCSQVDAIRTLGIKPDNNYSYPSWRRGFELAARTRAVLGIEPHGAIESMRDLVEHTLCIPVVQAQFNKKFAGATIATGDEDRGVVLNTDGQNQNVWIRRNTLAHELGHLLWDPGQRLNKLVVDEFSDFEDFQSNTPGKKDPVEIRANGFAVEFIAPRNGVVEIFQGFEDPDEGMMGVMDFYGVSFTAARWQLINSGTISADFKFGRFDTQPSEEWRAREDFTLDYFPLSEVPYSRRGRFVSVVVQAFDSGLISADTAGSHLGCDSEQFLLHRQDMIDFFR